MEVRVVGVVGLGLLGRGIAACLLAHGIPVIAFDVSAAECLAARNAIARALAELADHALCDPGLKTTWSERYVEAGSLSGLAKCDFIIESIVESPDAKAALFNDLESVLPAHVPIASNTSAIPITLLQKGRRHPARFLGMHWAEPAYATRFMELIRGELTGHTPMLAATQLALRLGKAPCVVERDIPGFIANRLGYAIYREACNLLNLGVADAETIDRSFRNSVGLWAGICGPFRWIDLTGGPALYGRAMAPVLPTLSNTAAVPEPILSMMETNAGGIRDGHGFFDYTPEQAKEWEDLYRIHVWRVCDTLGETFPLDVKEC